MSAYASTLVREEEEKLATEHEEIEQLEQETRVPEPLDEDAYGLGLATLVRDCERLLAGTEHAGARIARLVFSVVLLVSVISMQLYLLVMIKQFISAPAVHEARRVYDKYEWVMYGADESHMVLTVNGKHRGKPEFFLPSRFDTMSEKDKKTTCHIPLSQPAYFLTILFIWTLTCVADLQRSFNLAMRMLWGTPTVSSMRHATKVSEDDEKQLVIIGLTCVVKCVVGSIFFFRMFVTCALLWLGCRWLTATESFSDILLNAVALEFVLLLKDLLFISIVPPRNRRETANTLVMPLSNHDPPNFKILVVPFIWGALAVSWIFLYAYWLQQVLPDYRWDIREICTRWLANQSGATGEAEGGGHHSTSEN